MPATTPRVETFAIEDDHLVRKVVPRRGEPYEHRCPLAAYRELVWAAIDLAADGFTVETLVDRVRNRPREKHDDRDLSACNAQAESWASFTNAAVALAFWKERGIIETRHRRNYVDDGYFFEDAMIEFHFLEVNG